MDPRNNPRSAKQIRESIEQIEKRVFQKDSSEHLNAVGTKKREELLKEQIKRLESKF